MPKFSRNSLTFHRLGESYQDHTTPYILLNNVELPGKAFFSSLGLTVVFAFVFQ